MSSILPLRRQDVSGAAPLALADEVPFPDQLSPTDERAHAHQLAPAGSSAPRREKSVVQPLDSDHREDSPCFEIYEVRFLWGRGDGIVWMEAFRPALRAFRVEKPL
jgi:hypothetical protein